MENEIANPYNLGVFLLLLGGLSLLGVLATLVSSRIPIPRVTILVLLGVFLGPYTFNILPEQSLSWFPFVADMTLVLIGFLLGEHLTRRQLRTYGRTVLSASLWVAAVTSIAVGFACYFAGLPLHIAILLAAIAPATAPAATVAVVDDLGAKGSFAETLLQVVAIDDAWGILLFSLALAFAGSILDPEAFGFGEVMHGLREIFVSVSIGVGFGLPLAYLTQRIRDDEMTLSETLGMAFVAAGFAILVDASFLLAAVSMGIVVANVTKQHDRPFSAVHRIIYPFTSVFFVLSGASFDPRGLGGFGVAGAAYVLARIFGKIVGGIFGAWRGGMPIRDARWFGIALLPQAGVALGMALIAANRYPAYEQQIFGVVIGATILFEVFGPVATRYALRQTSALT